MRKGRESTTAQLVAMWRALAHEGHTSVRHYEDAFVGELLNARFRVMHHALRRRIQRMGPAERRRAIARYDPVPLRAAAIDVELMRAVERGARQVVLLGAGFDTRAFRLDALAGLTVFEVDHPATQATKQARARALPPPKARLVWTAVDFERDSLDARLAEVGHDPALPTAWVWEGVVMYLADAAVDATLAAVRGRSARGSTLILHYHEPSGGVLVRAVRAGLLGLLGEPQIGLRTRARMAAQVVQAGFTVRADLGIAEQAALVGGRAPDNDLARVSRVLTAEV